MDVIPQQSPRRARALPGRPTSPCSPGSETAARPGLQETRRASGGPQAPPSLALATPALGGGVLQGLLQFDAAAGGRPCPPRPLARAGSSLRQTPALGVPPRPTSRAWKGQEGRVLGPRRAPVREEALPDGSSPWSAALPTTRRPPPSVAAPPPAPVVSAGEQEVGRSPVGVGPARLAPHATAAQESLTAQAAPAACGAVVEVRGPRASVSLGGAAGMGETAVVGR